MRQDGAVRPLLAVAHRAGNDLAFLRAALDVGVDLVEADIYLFRNALELRHHKAIGPHLLWDEGRFTRRRDAALHGLRELLAAMPGDPRIMLDLKGPNRTLGPAVAAVLREDAPGVPITVCATRWSMLDAFDGDPHVRQVLSVSNRASLYRLRARLRRRPAFGVSILLRLLSPGIVTELRRSVEEVLVWPVDSPAALQRARRLGVTGVTSKNLALLKQLTAAG
jgi:glycerophosphoryl diester phosphodiesterase